MSLKNESIRAMSAALLELNRCHYVPGFPAKPVPHQALLRARESRRVDRRSHLLEQFLPSVRLRDKTLQSLGQHVTEFALLGETAAQNDNHFRVQRPQFVEDRIAVHNGK